MADFGTRPGHLCAAAAAMAAAEPDWPKDQLPAAQQWNLGNVRFRRVWQPYFLPQEARLSQKNEVNLQCSVTESVLESLVADSI